MRFHSHDNRLKGDPPRPIHDAGRPFFLIWRRKGMSSRALSLATVMLLIGCLTAGSAHAQNLEAGKSPSQIFAGVCTACHKSPRGLLKTVPASSLPGFLRQHYTTSSDMASVLSSYLVSNGANDPRYQAKDQPKGAKGGKEAGQEPKQSEQSERPGRRQHPGAASQEVAKPDADGLTPQGEGHPGRKGKRMARPSEPPEGAQPADGQTPEGAGEGKPSRHKLGRRGKPVEEKPDDAAKGETLKDDSKATAKGEDKGEAEKPASAKSSSDKSAPDKSPSDKSPSDKSESAKVDAPKEGVGGEPAPLRPDPVPPVTPAPPAATPAPAASSSPAPAASPAATPQPAAAASPVPAPAPPPVTAAAPPPSPPATPAGPPEPPISR
jgi:hypothetical protein